MRDEGGRRKRGQTSEVSYDAGACNYGRGIEGLKRERGGSYESCPTHT